jgi:hypothetical protein
MYDIMRKQKRKTYPKRHRYKVGDQVIFRFAGKTRTGSVVELTKEDVGLKSNVHATYVAECYGIQYPCLGIDDSKEFGNILTKDTKLGYPSFNYGTDSPDGQELGVSEDRGYRHMALPRLKDMCRKYKLKIGGNKKELVERLEKRYKAENEITTI